MLARKREEYKKRLTGQALDAGPTSPLRDVAPEKKPLIKPLYVSCLVDDIASIVHPFCVIITNPVLPFDDGPSLPVAFKLHTNFPFRYRVLPAPFGIVAAGGKVTLQIFVRSPPEQREAELASKGGHASSITGSSAAAGGALRPTPSSLLRETPVKKTPTPVGSSIATLLRYTVRKPDGKQQTFSPESGQPEKRASFFNFRSDAEKSQSFGGLSAGYSAVGTRSLSDADRDNKDRCSTQRFLVNRLSGNLSFPRSPSERPGKQRREGTSPSLPPRRMRAVSLESSTRFTGEETRSGSRTEARVTSSSPEDLSAPESDNDESSHQDVLIDADVVSDILRLEFRQIAEPAAPTDKNDDAAGASHEVGAKKKTEPDPTAALALARVVSDPTASDQAVTSQSLFRKIWEILETKTWSEVLPLQAELISDRDYEDAMSSVKSRFVRDLEKEKRQLEMTIQQLQSQKARFAKEREDVEAESHRLQKLQKASSELTQRELQFLSQVKSLSETSFFNNMTKLVEVESSRRVAYTEKEQLQWADIEQHALQDIPPPSRRRLKFEAGVQTDVDATAAAAASSDAAVPGQRRSAVVVPRWIGMAAIVSAVWSVLVRDFWA
jgi:hypothetical protein